MVRGIFLILTIAATAIFSVAQERYVRPVDNAAKDASFASFRRKLIAAAERRDADYILSILDPGIMNSFGGDGGIEEFKTMWRIDSKDSEFWREFLPVIKNGGDFRSAEKGEPPTFSAPYSFVGFPDDLDAFEFSVIFGRRVNLRASPDLSSRILGKLSYNIVRVVTTITKADDTESADWYEIESLGGLRGFVKAEYVRSPIDFRAGFQRKSGVWRMTYFLAGD